MCGWVASPARVEDTPQAEAAGPTPPENTPPSASLAQTLEALGLPDSERLAARYAPCEALYPWQEAALAHDDGAALLGRNLVFSAPASGGKTTVAEVY